MRFRGIFEGGGLGDDVSADRFELCLLGGFRCVVLSWFEREQNVAGRCVRWARWVRWVR